jgi:hypothetical protein
MVVTTALVIVVGALVQFFDQPLLQETANGGVQRTWTKTDLSAGAVGHVLQDGVAMPVSIRK